MSSFWHKVDKSAGPDACWPWMGCRAPNGYGKTSLFVRSGSGAHRAAFALVNGYMPDKGRVVMHSCDNPPCCNPAHLVDGTPSANMLDMVEKGRYVYATKTTRGSPQSGELNNAVRLTDEHVHWIRQLAKRGWKQRRIGALFGAAQGTISQIVTAKRRAGVT